MIIDISKFCKWSLRLYILVSFLCTCTILIQLSWSIHKIIFCYKWVANCYNEILNIFCQEWASLLTLCLAKSCSFFSLSRKPCLAFSVLVRSPLHVFSWSCTSSLYLSYTQFYICLNDYLINVCKLPERHGLCVFSHHQTSAINKRMKCLLGGNK